MLRSIGSAFALGATIAAGQSSSVSSVEVTSVVSTANALPTAVKSVTQSASFSISDPELADVVLHYDNATYGPTLELVHAFYTYWPTGVGVASDGTVFTSYADGDSNYTLAMLTGPLTDIPWPNIEWNTPPSFANETNAGYSIATDKFLLIQSVVVDGLDRVWALDTGRPIVDGSVLLATVPGGPKLSGFYLNGTNFQTYTFPADVVYADSSMNDVRVDCREGGYAYITDQASAHPGIIVLDLETGESWRHLNGHFSVNPDNAFTPIYNGQPFYIDAYGAGDIETLGEYATDGMALSADGEYLYYSPIASDKLSRVPTSFLKVPPGGANPYAALKAKHAVEYLGEMGSNADGMETDSSGYIYAGAPEYNGIARYNPETGLVEGFIRNPVIQWPDTLSVATVDGQGYVYFTNNQAWLSPGYHNGTDMRVKPGAMFRVAIEAGKATQLD